jgi:hypothetical protein
LGEAPRYPHRNAKEEILRYDTCCEVKEEKDEGDERACYWFNFGPYRLELKYIYRDTVPASGRYSISGEDLNSALTGPDADHSEREEDPEDRMFGRRLSASLTRLINQEQAFCVVPSQSGIVYSHSHFYRPEVTEAVLSILEPCAALSDQVTSEKGDTRVTAASRWGNSTLFGLVYRWLNGAATEDNKFASDLQGCNVVICDDRRGETADFYGIDDLRRRVLIVHAKAQNGTPGVSARKLQEVTRQAQASLAFAGSARRDFTFPTDWNEPWSVKLSDARGAVISRPRVTSKPKLSAEKAHGRIINALADPTYTKEVIMFTSGILSASAARTAHNEPIQLDLQFLYFLASVRTTFDRAGVRYRIICNP